MLIGRILTIMALAAGAVALLLAHMFSTLAALSAGMAARGSAALARPWRPAARPPKCRSIRRRSRTQPSTAFFAGTLKGPSGVTERSGYRCELKKDLY